LGTIGEESILTLIKPKVLNDHPIVVPPAQANHVAIVDTGATGHYLDTAAETHCTKVTPTSNGPSVQVANGETIETTKHVIVPLAPELSTQAKTGHIFDSLQSGSLISIGQLCDDDCVALFSKYDVKIIKDGQVIILGKRNPNNGLWNIPLAPKAPMPLAPPKVLSHSANGAIRHAQTKQDLANFLHACAFSPVPSTFLRAVQRGHFQSWPGLTPSLITKHLSKSLATSKGHLRMIQQNIQSTKVLTAALPMATSLDVSPSQEPSNTLTNVVFAVIVSTSDISKSYSDQTGKFPVQSSRGYNYVMILYHYDSNAILSKPLKTRQAAELTKAWTALHTRLQLNGYAPNLHILDNECSEDLKNAFQKHQVDFQRVPPHVHRRNSAERAIQTWKNHFCAGLATCDPKFPLTEWDLLMPQADLTLNLLRSSRRQPRLSAYACLHGTFDFNRSPLAPPGTRVVVHLTPAQRPNMGPHGVDGWYVGPSPEHYRCHKCYIPSTCGVRDALTVDWFPHKVPFPKVSTDEYLRQTATDMLTLIQGTATHPIPSLTYGSSITNAYIQIAQILKRATASPTPAEPLPPAPELRVPIITAPPAPDPTPIVPTPAPEQRVQWKIPVATPNSPNALAKKPTFPANRPASILHSPSRPSVPAKQPVLPANKPASMLYSPSSRPNVPAKKLPLPSNKPVSSLLKGPPRPSRRRLPPPSRHASGPLAQAATSLPYANHIAALVTTPPTAGKQGSLRKLRKGPEAHIWERSLANEWGRLLEHGLGQTRAETDKILGTGTIFFISKSDVPQDRKVTYANFVCNIRPQKAETHRVRMTAGGDKLDYPGDASSPTVSMLDSKIHINSTISDASKGARHLGLDIANYFLGTPMEYFQYMRVKPSDIPQEVWDDPRYNIEIAPDGFVYLEIRRGMYGLKEAAIIAFNQLVQKLAPYGYEPTPFTPGLWRHRTKKTTFVLCVDDFGVKYFSKADALHLIDAIQSHYKLTIDWSGSLYCGLTLDWHYEEGYVDVSMPGYVKRALAKFNHPTPLKKQHAPHPWVAPVYGSSKPQNPTPESAAPLLDKDGTKRIQSISGTFLYYGRAVDPCILPALNEIASQQAKPTTDTIAITDMLMDYLYNYPDAIIRYYASDMLLKITSDAAYLVQPKARSRAAVHYHLGWKNSDRVNGALDILCQTIKNVVTSAAESETGGIFIGGKHAIPIRTALEELGHPQPATPFDTDNNTAQGILNSKMRQKLSKSFDMRYWWMKDRIAQGQFDLKWAPGKFNLADYFTKHHPPWHHRKMRYKYLQKVPSIQKTT
jgi:hypothetical protein